MQHRREWSAFGIFFFLPSILAVVPVPLDNKMPPARPRLEARDSDGDQTSSDVKGKGT